MGQFCGNARGHQAIASAVLRLAVPEREEVGGMEALLESFGTRRYTYICQHIQVATTVESGGVEHGLWLLSMQQETQ